MTSDSFPSAIPAPSAFGVCDQPEGVLHELGRVEVIEPQPAGAQRVAGLLERPHAIAPHRPVVGEGEREDLPVAIGLEALRLDADEVGCRHNHRVQPRVPAAAPREPRAVLELHARRGADVGQARPGEASAAAR